MNLNDRNNLILNKEAIMRLTKLMILPIVLLMGACSTTYTPNTDQSSSYDFSTVKTFSVIGDDHNNNSLISDINRERIDIAVTTALIQQGKQEDNIKSADVLISYFIVTKDKIKVNSNFNGSYNRFGYYGMGGGSHINVRNYVEGTLVIDVIDNQSQKIVWRSSLTKTLKHYENNQERDEAVTKAVNSMMSQLPSV